MNRVLTPEFAQTVPLPRNPIKRHREVMDILEDKGMVGDDILDVRARGAVAGCIDAQTEQGTLQILIDGAWLPWFGRGVLERVAQGLQRADTVEPI